MKLFSYFYRIYRLWFRDSYISCLFFLFSISAVCPFSYFFWVVSPFPLAFILFLSPWHLSHFVPCAFCSRFHSPGFSSSRWPDLKISLISSFIASSPSSTSLRSRNARIKRLIKTNCFSPTPLHPFASLSHYFIKKLENTFLKCYFSFYKKPLNVPSLFAFRSITVIHFVQ